MDGVVQRQAWNEPWTPRTVLGAAFVIWMAFLVMLLGVFAVTLFVVAPGLVGPVQGAGEGTTFVPVMVTAMVLVSASGLMHWWLFRRYWAEGVVQPKGYLIAAVQLWVSVSFCVVVALLGAVIDGSLFPNILLAGMLVLLLMGTWPSGRAMVVKRAREEEDDDVELFHLPSSDDER